MLTGPRKQKFRKSYNIAMHGIVFQDIAFGDFGMKVTKCGFLTGNQLEAARKAISHYTNRQGKVWIRVFPQVPVTKKGQGVRMGSGKGAVEYFGTPVKVGAIIFEISGVSREIATEAFRLAGNKLPISYKLVTKI